MRIRGGIRTGYYPTFPDTLIYLQNADFSKDRIVEHRPFYMVRIVSKLGVLGATRTMTISLFIRPRNDFNICCASTRHSHKKP